VAAVVAQVADSRAEARRLLRERLPRWLGLAGYAPVDGRARPARDPVACAGWLCRVHPVGTAADCDGAMAETARRIGIGHLIRMVEGSGDPAAVRENIARLGAEVLPRLPGGTAPRRTRAPAREPAPRPGNAPDAARRRREGLNGRAATGAAAGVRGAPRPGCPRRASRPPRRRPRR